LIRIAGRIARFYGPGEIIPLQTGFASVHDLDQMIHHGRDDFPERLDRDRHIAELIEIVQNELDIARNGKPLISIRMTGKKGELFYFSPRLATNCRL